MNIAANIFLKNQQTEFNSTLKGSCQLGFISEMLDGSTYADQSVWYNMLIRYLKITIPIDALKSICKLSSGYKHLSVIKILNKIGIERYNFYKTM